VSYKSIFQLHAALMWTINDFLAYGDLLGWNRKVLLHVLLVTTIHILVG
jgi:hypothetical protein